VDAPTATKGGANPFFEGGVIVSGWTVDLMTLHYSLAFIAFIVNTGYSVIPPVLPLELDRIGIANPCLTPIFLAFSVGASVAPTMISKHLAALGPRSVMSASLLGMATMIWCIAHALTLFQESAIVGVLTVLQLANGMFFASITTSYYSLATTLVDDSKKNSAMSWIESGVGLGYIVGPMLGSFLYDEVGFKSAYTLLAVGLAAIALINWRCLAANLVAAPLARTVVDAQYVDVESQLDDASNRTFDDEQMSREPGMVSLASDLTLLVAVSSITWVNTSWSFLEPILAKHLEQAFGLGNMQIGLVFSSSNFIYVPAVFLVQSLPQTNRHRTLTMSILMTAVCAILVGSKSLAISILGVVLIGVLPTPVWVMLLPYLQDEALKAFPSVASRRRLNDRVVGLYNSFMTLGSLVGYSLGPICGKVGFAATTKIVALLISGQAILFHFLGNANKVKCNNA
ncbi:hypothetical protein THAOC_11017, partial [Thalassiosira oceanica]